MNRTDIDPKETKPKESKPKERKSSFKTLDLVFTAVGAVLIAICSWISIPTAIPFTLQTFAVFLVLSVLGGKRGTLSILVYILLGAVGVPVFSGFTSGIGILLGTTGGYIIGFIFMGLLYWLAVGLLSKKLWVEILALVIGMAVMYAFGTAWFMVVYTRTTEAIGVWSALSWCVFPFLIPDFVKLGLAMLLARRIPALAKIK